MKKCAPHACLPSPAHHHLFVALNWQRAEKAGALTQTKPSVGLSWGTDPSQNPHYYSLLIPMDLLSSQRQTYSRAESYDGGGAVFVL